MYISYYESKIGKITLISDGINLTNLAIKGQNVPLIPDLIIDDSLDVFVKTKEWLDRYFKGINPGPFNVPIKLNVNEFRSLVYKILLDIPYGSTITYGDIAKKICKIRNQDKMSSQAVGKAIGSNPIAIIIPCHRVIGKNNRLTGYNGGVNLKVKLLEIEGIDTSKFD